MNYSNFKRKAESLRKKFNAGKEAKKELEEMLGKLTEDPPDSPIRWTFSADKWDYEYRSNFLLHFLEMKGLSKEADEFLDLFPNRRDED